MNKIPTGERVTDTNCSATTTFSALLEHISAWLLQSPSIFRDNKTRSPSWAATATTTHHFTRKQKSLQRYELDFSISYFAFLGGGGVYYSHSCFRLQQHSFNAINSTHHTSSYKPWAAWCCTGPTSSKFLSLCFCLCGSFLFEYYVSYICTGSRDWMWYMRIQHSAGHTCTSIRSQFICRFRPFLSMF